MLRPRIVFLLLVIISITLIGWTGSCTQMKISKGFSYTMEDGSRVVINIEYKPQSEIRGNNKFGSYYYIVQYFPKNPKKSPRQLLITFYDRKGYSLFKSQINERDYSGHIRELVLDGFVPGISIASSGTAGPAQKNKIDGGWEWKGQFGESCITVENFREIDSVKVKYLR